MVEILFSAQKDKSPPPVFSSTFPSALDKDDICNPLKKFQTRLGAIFLPPNPQFPDLHQIEKKSTFSLVRMAIFYGHIMRQKKRKKFPLAITYDFPTFKLVISLLSNFYENK